MVCRKMRKFALNLEVYVHLMFAKNYSQMPINKGFCYAKENLYVHQFGRFSQF